MKTAHICQFCHKSFSAYSSNKRKFCSRKCFKKQLFLDCREKKTCPICHKQFLTRIKAKFCSFKCFKSQAVIITNTCIVCKRTFSKKLLPSEINKYKFKYCSHACRNLDNRPPHLSGEKSSNWKGGIIKSANGYIWQSAPNHPCRDLSNYVYQHRLVAEQYLGRFLKNEEVVHHINYNKSDNRPENLYVFASSKEHMSFHKRKNIKLKSNLL